MFWIFIHCGLPPLNSWASGLSTLQFWEEILPTRHRPGSILTLLFTGLLFFAFFFFLEEESKMGEEARLKLECYSTFSKELGLEPFKPKKKKKKKKRRRKKA